MAQQFINAVLEEDGSKLDKVAVIRLCGSYSQGKPPFGEIRLRHGLYHRLCRVLSDRCFVVAGFPPRLRRLMYGHVAFVDGGYQGEITVTLGSRLFTHVLLLQVP